MTLKKILLAYNGTSSNEQELEWGLNFIRQTPVETVIVKVIEPQNLNGRNNRQDDGPESDDLGTGCNSLLEMAANALEDRECSATITVLAGDPTTEIIQFAQREQVDLILYGSSGLAAMGTSRTGTPDRRKSGQYKVYSLRAIAAS